MIVEVICYKCTCAKCGKVWITKTHVLPKTCARCKSIKWNSDYQPPIEVPRLVEVADVVDDFDFGA